MILVSDLLMIQLILPINAGLYCFRVKIAEKQLFETTAKLFYQKNKKKLSYAQEQILNSGAIVDFYPKY